MIEFAWSSYQWLWQFFSLPSAMVEPQLTNGAFLRHALRSPVTALLISLEASLQTPSKQHYLKKALAASHHLAQLLQPETDQQFDPLKSTQQLCTFFTFPDQSQMVHLINKLEQPLALAGSTALFQEVLNSLITNALEAYPKNTSKLVIITLWAECDRLRLTVTDFGQGMNWLTQKLATKKGFSTKGRGSGYGLWFANALIKEKFGGQLHIKSQLKTGTTVTLSLPVLNVQPVTETPNRLQSLPLVA